VEKIKYTEEQLGKFAQGAFKDNPNEKLFYANEEGDFRTEAQLEAMDKAAKAAFVFSFENGAEAEKPVVNSEELEALKKEVARLGSLKSVKDAKATLAAKDKSIAELKAKIVELTPNP